MIVAYLSSIYDNLYSTEGILLKLNSTQILYTAIEGPVRIQCKYLDSDLCFPRNETARLRCLQNIIIMFCLLISTFMYLWAIYIFPGSVCIFCCSQIGRLIMGVYKSLTDTWMWNKAEQFHTWEYNCTTNLTFFRK